ncbi:hypothetical protein PUR71_25290 [Streptomyces sp. SP17BM10]|uniref:hypothetical protein n=1 Tax=Streptomyces sp. SP17BM10 TaxID=3002530 RepID=UPI002E77DA33|nr:hypothetical protein [Streptomyces sp. SP17BM10]MEE1786188.1 hypothetical protein [Streptomyces sp. SP17BM10]
MVSSEVVEFRVGDRVWVYRDSAFGAVEGAVVVEVRPDGRLRVEFTDGHRAVPRDGHVELRASAVG